MIDEQGDFADVASASHAAEAVPYSDNGSIIAGLFSNLEGWMVLEKPENLEVAVGELGFGRIEGLPESNDASSSIRQRKTLAAARALLA